MTTPVATQGAQEKCPSTPSPRLFGDADVPSPGTCLVNPLAGREVTRHGIPVRLPRGSPSDWDAARAAIEIVCGKWVLSVVAELAEGPKQHNQLATVVTCECVPT